MKGKKKYFFYFLILDQLCKDLHIMKHPLQILLFFSFAPIEKNHPGGNAILCSGQIVYKKKKANYRQLTLEKILVIINEFPHSKGMAVIICKTCIVIKEFQTKTQP